MKFIIPYGRMKNNHCIHKENRDSEHAAKEIAYICSRISFYIIKSELSESHLYFPQVWIARLKYPGRNAVDYLPYVFR
ncbi:leucyl-tRNA synthetase [Oceanobacillus picturae]|uniref:Leucyl-tRNA synthetase n=1 Tax=Oceanobacillus picturae TaxID=171693 RepID=A0A0U9H3K1_9BACI|nr:leucyl-tRNA synthetase [Oceanobacillus picturae]